MSQDISARNTVNEMITRKEKEIEKHKAKIAQCQKEVDFMKSHADEVVSRLC